MECCLRHIGRWQAGRGVDGTTASARGVPRSAPRSNPRLGGSNTCLAPYFNILTFSDAVCCSSQLASSSVAHPGPNAAGNALLVTDGDVDTRFVHSILFWYTLGASRVKTAAGWGTYVPPVTLCGTWHSFQRGTTSLGKSQFSTQPNVIITPFSLVWCTYWEHDCPSNRGGGGTWTFLEVQPTLQPR